MKLLTTFAVSTLLLFCSATLLAHHSPFLYFDPSQSVIVEGEITGYKWRNPHAVFMLNAKDEAGQDVEWLLETHSVSILKRMNLTKDDVKVGDRVRVAGWPSQRGGEELFITNMLMPGGEEVVFDAGAPLLWSDQRVGDGSAWMTTEDSIADNNYSDIFHVWSTSLVAGEENLLFENYGFELTAEAAAAQAAFDMFNHPILGTCVFKGMPTIMEQPYPVQFAKSDGLILMHMEEGNTVRVFDMRAETDFSNEEPTNLGHSVGKWVDGTLVVSTTGSNWQWVDLTGIPNSPSAVYTEQFTPSADGKKLDYSLSIEDPAVFSQAPVFTKYWLAVPGERVNPYNCEED